MRVSAAVGCATVQRRSTVRQRTEGGRGVYRLLTACERQSIVISGRLVNALTRDQMAVRFFLNPSDQALEQDDTLGRAEHTRTAVGRRTPPLGTVAVIAIVCAATAAFVIGKREDLPVAWRSIRHASPGWLMLGLMLSGALVVNMAALEAATQRLFGVHRTARRTLRLTARSHFLNMVTKSGGMAGIAVFNGDSRRHGLSVHRTTAGYIVAELAFHIGFTIVLLMSLPQIAHDHRLNAANTIGLAIFTALTVVFIAAVVAAGRSRESIRRLHSSSTALRNRAARILRRPHHVRADDHHAADDLHSAVVLARQHRRGLAPVAVHAILYPLIGVSLLWGSMHALGVSRGFRAALVGYCIATVFSMIGVLPAGLGFTEASLAATLASYGIPSGRAVAVVCVYRVFELWVPLAAGALAVRERTHAVIAPT